MSSYRSISLSPTEAAEFRRSVDGLRRSGVDPVDAAFFDRSWEYVDLVPYRLREHLAGLRREQCSVLVVDGLPLSPGDVGRTPPSWRQAEDRGAGRGTEYYLGLVAMSLGEVFAWSNLQRGRLIQNVLPVAGMEDGQSGHSSSTELNWHTEDCFHPNRPDYVVLMGLRNPDEVATFVSSVRDLDLPDPVRAVLHQDRFQVVPDDEHSNQPGQDALGRAGLATVAAMRRDPEYVSVLFGARDEPYLRVDPTFMACDPDDSEARAALDTLHRSLVLNQHEVVVRSGTLVVLDNFAVVHGRRPFEPRYDGSDRWLKKAIVARDLRSSRLARASAAGRRLAYHPRHGADPGDLQPSGSRS